MIFSHLTADQHGEDYIHHSAGRHPAALPPSVDENGVRLRLSGTWLDDDEQAAHDAQVAGRLLGTTETAERPGVSARTVERLVIASRQSVQPAMARGYQGQARDVPDDAFQRRTTAIGRPVAAAEG